MNEVEYFSMFSGQGGFENGIESVLPSARCVGYSEIDKWASAVYRLHFPTHKNFGDATEIIPQFLPDFKLFVGGFPCQAFSIAGKRLGFEDTRGTLFFDVQRVLQAKRPEWILLENVKNLCSHDDGRTFATIYRILTDLGYTVGWKVVNGVEFGVPQSRERIFIIGHLGGPHPCFQEILSISDPEEATVPELPASTALDANYWKGIDNHGQRTAIIYWKNSQEQWTIEQKRVAGTIKSQNDLCRQQLIQVGNIGSQAAAHRVYSVEGTPRTLTGRGGVGAKTGLYTDGHDVRRLTPLECERLQGFPDNWTKYGIIDGEKVEISDTQRYTMNGNAVIPAAVSYFIEKMFADYE